MTSGMRPVLAVSVGIYHQGKVLLAARGQQPLAGLYTFPGGKVEAGETLQSALLREVYEEIGVTPLLAGFIDHVEIITRDATGIVTAHYIVAAFAARWGGDAPRTSAEAPDLRWAAVEGLDGLPVTEGLQAIVRKGQALIYAESEPPYGAAG